MTRAEQDQILNEMDKLETEIMFYKSRQASDGLTQAEMWCLEDAQKKLRQLKNIRRK